jgi:hypothetical protein
VDQIPKRVLNKGNFPPPPKNKKTKFLILKIFFFFFAGENDNQRMKLSETGEPISM